jgi:predicted Fe-Mo cluster-binding NifX family protein
LKIAVTSAGDSINAQISERFGRCKYFLIIDSDTMSCKVFPNPGEQLSNGSGPVAAEKILNEEVKVLLTGNVGDKALSILRKGDVEIVDGFKEPLKVIDAVRNYLKQK